MGVVGRDRRRALLLGAVVFAAVFSVVALAWPSPDAAEVGSDSDEQDGVEQPAEVGRPATAEPESEPERSTSTGPGEEAIDPSACVRASASGPAWKLVFAEDFDGDVVDPDHWTLYDSPGNAGFGLRRPAAIGIENGNLVITAAMVDGDLVSGGMAHRFDQRYGRWEFRVRTDADPSGATSGVVLTWPESGDWPIDGENDMYETGRTPERTPFHTFVHYGADNSQEYLTHEADGTRWHDMAMEWTPDGIAMFLDGRPAGTVSEPAAIPHVPHHLTIQLDAWADTMGEPVRMEVDRVRVYSYEPDGICGDEDDRSLAPGSG